jgi:hypothetical protein
LSRHWRAHAPRHWQAGARASAVAVLAVVSVAGVSMAGATRADHPVSSADMARAVGIEALWIREAQLPDGAIAVDPGSSQISPYAANYAALGLARAASELHYRPDADAAWQWLAWYQAHQDAAGFVTDYELTADGTEASTQTYDSTDAYAGTFLTAAAATWQADPDQARLKSLARGITRAVAAIQATQTADGLTWAKPSYRVKLLMDNAEAYGGLRSAVTLATALGEPALATRATTDARHMAAGVASWWNPHSGGFDWARDSNGTNSATSWAVLYPDAMENAWAVAYGLATPAQAASILSHLERMQPRWAEPDQSALMASGTGVSQQSVGYWPVAGWALTLTGQDNRALDAAATISAGTAAQQRTWPFNAGAAGQLIALQSGWPATAPWAAPLSADDRSSGLGTVAIILVILAALAVAALVTLKALTRRSRPPGASWRRELARALLDRIADRARRLRSLG